MEIFLTGENKGTRVYCVDENGLPFGFKDEKIQKRIEKLKNAGLFLNGKDVYRDFLDEENSVCYYTAIKGSIGKESIKKAFYRLCELLRKENLDEIEIMANELSSELSYIAEALVMSLYSYDRFLTEKSKIVSRICFFADEKNRKYIDEGRILGEAVNIARDLVNEPANSQTPYVLADEIEALGKKWGFEVEVLKGEALEKIHAEALKEVGKASSNPPAFIIMRYNGDPESSDRAGLIGKGVTYDSGGLNLKSGARFITMKHDMAGSGTMTGVMCALAGLKAKVNATAIVAACENVISGNAYKPGDIIGSMKGSTIEITSTDAEGRLTMIDALYYAAKNENVNCLIDIATLTGAARRMLGDYGAPYLSTNESLAQSYEKGASESGELVVRLPFIEDALSTLRSYDADYVNSARGEVCGCITAGLFLREFTEDLPYLHIDAAGPLWLERSFDGFLKGGSGWGVRTIYHMLTK